MRDMSDHVEAARLIDPRLRAGPLVALAVVTGPIGVELRWLDRDQVEDLIPDLHHSVRSYLHLRFILHGRREGDYLAASGDHQDRGVPFAARADRYSH